MYKLNDYIFKNNHIDVCLVLPPRRGHLVELSEIFRILSQLQLLPALQGTDCRQGSDWSKTKNLHQARDEGSIGINIETADGS